MQNIEMSYRSQGTSALKAAPCDARSASAHIIKFPAETSTGFLAGDAFGRRSNASCAEHAHEGKFPPVARFTRLQSAIIVALGACISFATLFM